MCKNISGAQLRHDLQLRLSLFCMLPLTCGCWCLWSICCKCTWTNLFDSFWNMWPVIFFVVLDSTSELCVQFSLFLWTLTQLATAVTATFYHQFTPSAVFTSQNRELRPCLNYRVCNLSLLAHTAAQAPLQSYIFRLCLCIRWHNMIHCPGRRGGKRGRVKQRAKSVHNNTNQLEACKSLCTVPPSPDVKEATETIHCTVQKQESQSPETRDGGALLDKIKSMKQVLHQTYTYLLVSKKAISWLTTEPNNFWRRRATILWPAKTKSHARAIDAKAPTT